jgi:galactosylceramidase
LAPTPLVGRQALNAVDLLKKVCINTPHCLLQTNEPCRKSLPAKLGAVVRGLFCCLSTGLLLPVFADQTIDLKGDAAGKRFDGIGAVSGGGATSVLLKDYPEPQRSQVLDLLFKPKFGASMSVLLVEVPGDGNSTQGSEPSHMHARNDLNFSRGYEWWLMREARKRNPDLALDACAWGCPGWVGGGNFWSQDMCDYYVKWIQGLKRAYGLNLDAIGCRNEKGVNEDFAKKFRATLNVNGLQKVKLHGFDNWDKTKFDWTSDMSTDEELRKAVDVFSNHTMAESPTPENVRKLADALNKPIWNSEEHVYKKGFDCEISIVKAFNENYIRSGVTRIVNWYLVGSVYPMECYSEEPAAMIANSPWSGYYRTREALWGYAHYGQFSKIGWQYLDGACGTLAGGGTFVTLKSPGNDYSVILETKNATNVQNVTFNISGGLSTRKLCVWRSDATAQFVRQADVAPANGSFTIALQPDSVYSISTTTGQQKGSFPDVPAAKDFPFPYYETFDEYASPRQWGYLPHYTADIAGVFEISDRPDKTGKCLRQVINKKAQSWAPEWMPYTIIGDEHWQDCDISADVYLDNGGWAGVMGRVNNAGYGYGSTPKGYYMRLAADGRCALYAATQATNEVAGSRLLATGTAANIAGHQWHNIKLRFSGDILTGFVDAKPVLTVTNDLYSRGMAGLITGGDTRSRNTALFDNLLINAVGADTPKPAVFTKNRSPIY